jgi:tetratricopeptide (TPR) repeat protein
MKFKPIYIYASLIILVIIFLVVFTQSNNSTSPKVPGDISGKQMPHDEIHKNLQSPLSGAPSSNNLNESARHQVEEMKKAIDENPNDTVKLKEYADFLSAHQPSEAIKYYEKILKINPKREDVLFSLSYIYYNQKNLSKAEEYTSEVLALDKNNLEANYNLGAIAASRGDKEKARQIWNKLISDHPGSEIAQLAKSSLQKL